MERYGLMAVVPTLTALLLSSLNDLQFFFVCLYALLEFRAQSIIGKCTSRHPFPYGGLLSYEKISTPAIFLRAFRVFPNESSVHRMKYT